MLEELEAGELEFETVGEFLAEIKREFGREEEKSVKTVELRKLEQGKLGWERQREEEAKEEAGRKWEEKNRGKKQKRGKTVEVKRVAEKWEIWDEEEEAAKLEVEARKLVPEKFHKWIKIFGKKQLEQMPTRKVWDHTIEMKEVFVPRKGKVYPLSREEREEVREFVREQLRKEYIWLSKLPQTAPVFFVGKKDKKKQMV